MTGDGDSRTCDQSLEASTTEWRLIMSVKMSMMMGAMVLAFGLTSTMVAQGGCIDDPCPAAPPHPAPAPVQVHPPAPAPAPPPPPGQYSSSWQWKSKNFPAPNGGFLVFRIMPDGNPACASYDAQNCLWGQNVNQIEFNRVHPLVCGAAHRSVWGVSGYEDPNHWCNLAKSS